MRKDKIDYHEHDDLSEDFAGTLNVASAGESTGMMPTPPLNSFEYNSYQDMAGMAIPKVAPAKEPRAEKRHANRKSRSKNEDFRPML